MVSPTPSLDHRNDYRFHGFVVSWFRGFMVLSSAKNLSNSFFWPESKFLKSCVILRKARDSRIEACCVHPVCVPSAQCVPSVRQLLSHWVYSGYKQRM